STVPLVLDACFFSVKSTPPLYTLSLHDALPILSLASAAYAFYDLRARTAERQVALEREARAVASTLRTSLEVGASAFRAPSDARSEEHTSELQSRGHLVCRLLLEKIQEGSQVQA